MADEGMLEDTKDELKRRLKSPYAGSYALALCAVNYEFLIVVFSEGTYVDKIGYITQHLYRDQSIWHTFGLPALLALIPVIALPLLNLLADLWSQGVQVGGTHLSQWMETGKRLSDPELRLLARNRGLEIRAIRHYAINTWSLCSELALERAKQQEHGVVGWANLSHFYVTPPKDANPALASVVKRAGFPVAAFGMLQSMQNEGPRAEDQLLSGGDPNERDKRRGILALLFGTKLIGVVWAEGPQPYFELTQGGAEFLKFVVELHPEVLK